MNMNSSNPIRDSPPERVERDFGSVPSSSVIDVVASEKPKDLNPRENSFQKYDSPTSQRAGLEKIEDEDEDFVIPERFTKNGRRKAVSFPLKLMQVLSKKEHADIITWLPDGKSFKIVRPRAFKKDILPKYFKEAKYSSFKRKISRWGFQPVKCDEQSETDWFGSEIFRHEYFQRGDLKLAEKMSCKKAVPVHPNLSRPVQTAKQSTTSPRVSKPSNRKKESLSTKPELSGNGQSLVNALPSLPLRDTQTVGRAQMDSLESAIDAEVRRRLREREMALPEVQHAAASRTQVESLEAAIEAEVRRRLRESGMALPERHNDRTQMDSLETAIDAEVRRRLREREMEMTLGSNMRINALVQQKLAGAHRPPPLALPSGTGSDLLNLGGADLLNMGMLPSINPNINALRALGHVPQPSTSAAILEEQRLKLRMLQEAQYLSLMSSEKKDHARSA